MNAQRDVLQPLEIDDAGPTFSYSHKGKQELAMTAGSPWGASRPSRWSCSPAKRCFDCFCVLLALPLLLPSFLIIALAVRLTSSGPVFFVQRRMGCHGRSFPIFKFRTMIYAADNARQPVTTVKDHRFTAIGPFLRRWKLDELPQVLNVLMGHMSLVGPRPKVPEHVSFDLPCRPGITGAATIAFAHEEMALERIPKQHLKTYYHSVVLPAKLRLDSEYIARATFLSDLRLIVNSVFRRWDTAIMDRLLDAGAFEMGIVPERSCTTIYEAAHAFGTAPASRKRKFPPSSAELPEGFWPVEGVEVVAKAIEGRAQADFLNAG